MNLQTLTVEALGQVGDDLADLVPPAGPAVARVHAHAVDARLLLCAALVAGTPGNCEWQKHRRENLMITPKN